MKNLRWKWTLILAVVLLCVAGIASRKIRLGLDLQGGSHIVLQIQVQDAFKAAADSAMESLQEALAKQNIAYASIERNDPATIDTGKTIQIAIKGVPADRAPDFRRIVTDLTGQEWTLSTVGPSDYRLDIRGEAAARLAESTLKQSMQTMERKVNGLGVAEASVQARGGSGGDSEILVQLPGVDDPARVKSILQTSALLELTPAKDGPFPSRDALFAKHGGVLPLNSKVAHGSTRAGGGAENWWLLSRSPVVTGRDLRDARAQQGELPNQWETAFTLTQEAARRFEKFTSANIGNRLAIVLDNAVLSAPVIESTIADRGTIRGAATVEEAQDLALNLRAGALPAGVKVIDDRTVGASLGADSIRRGVTAGIVSLLLVVASMLLYYRGAGVNAVCALLLNTILTVAALGYLDAPWTLPGIAGLVLSIGMAVDSNVLIFERIKEELRSGRNVASSISAGFDRALVTIVDTHVTTVVASAFLFVFGTGPVRGFAVTLVIGLIANLFTAVFVSRAIFDTQLFRKPRLATLSIGRDLFRQTSFDFLSKRAFTLGLSALAILVSLGSLAMKGGPRMGLDFRGGALIYVRFAPMPAIDELRAALSAGLPGEVTVQEDRNSSEYLIGTEVAGEAQLEQTREAVLRVLRDKYANLGGRLDLNNATQTALAARLGNPDVAARILAFRDRERSGVIRSLDELSAIPGVDLATLKEQTGLSTFNLRSSEMVGPRAGEELRQRALLATLSALAGMLIYIAFRFQWISGAAAVIATLHDVVITIGLFSLTDREINLNIVAALLTLIGYSMNDKIVVFDRVRENLQSGRKLPFLDLVNQSINQTLSRTLLTAGPTLLACIALYFLGGPVLNGIAFALFVGIVVGTYSSIFVASALLVMWTQYRDRRVAAPSLARADRRTSAA
jgi:preprotein translocase subunit SecD